MIPTDPHHLLDVGGRRRAALRLVLGAAACLGVLGCSAADPDAVPAVPAAGTVKYKGKPIETGTIQFVPDKGRAASGTIEAGEFKLTTYADGDGAIPGQHKVAIFATKQVAAKKKGQEPTAVSIIPTNYSQTQSSGVFVEIPPGGKTDIEINLQ